MKPVELKPVMLSSAVPLAEVAFVPPNATETGAERAHVPEDVMAPPVKPVPQVTDVTVPTPLTAWKVGSDVVPLLVRTVPDAPGAAK
jgi:hypothetical protein